MNITIKQDAEKYINNLDENTLLIYSPTSLKKIDFNNKKIKSINWHILSKKLNILEKTIEKNEKINKVVTFGGGSTIDIGKYISYKLNIKYICIPSMLSTNSYATDKVALIEKNKKITLEAKLPDCIIIDDRILKLSETENLYGIADVLSIYTALFDWKLANNDIKENIDENIYNMALELLHKVIDYILNNDFEKIVTDNMKLFEYIGTAGYITNLYSTGRPESGSEHIFAKELESRINVPHGISVSLGILIMSIMQGRFSKDINEAIRRITTLDKISIYGVDKKIIEESLMNIQPRKNRYTIVDRYYKDIAYKRKILEEFYSKNII